MSNNKKFTNPWKSLSEENGTQFIHSAGLRFRVTFVSDDVDAVNDHCRMHEDRGLIAIDEEGLYYVALVEPE